MGTIKKQAKQGEARLDQYVNNLNPEQQQPLRDKLFTLKAIRQLAFSIQHIFHSVDKISDNNTYRFVNRLLNYYATSKLKQ